ncbi:MAG: NAD(P)H-dependent oxidoreductase [Oscillospiraceae bacterium]|nr:NAD(P)H-dependent oxidoreductase [Oscillospiraceae bacterium]
MKRVIIYYSLSGNTKQAAELLSRELGADLCALELVKPMPDAMWKRILTGGGQVCMGVKPSLKPLTTDLAAYDEILLGFPIWAGKAASPVSTLLARYPVADKVAALFTLSGTGSNDKCLAALSKKLPSVRASLSLKDYGQAGAENEASLKAFAEKIKALS